MSYNQFLHNLQKAKRQAQFERSQKPNPKTPTQCSTSLKKS